MRFVTYIFEKSGMTQYRWAKSLGISLQSVQYILGVTARPRSRKSMDLRLLCKLRKSSGLSWDKFGKLLDSEFSD
jgi:DNA-binding transcriptional regulator YiaG